MASYSTGRNRLYRSRRGSILGVCRGIAEWRDLPVDMVRLIWVLLTLFVGGFPGVILYLVLAFVLPLEPEYRDDYSENRSRGRRSDNVDSEFEDLKERVRKMEDEEVDKERDWESRFRDN